MINRNSPSSNEALSLLSLIAANLVLKKAKKTLNDRKTTDGLVLVKLRYFHVKPSVVVGVDFKTKTFIRILG